MQLIMRKNNGYGFHAVDNKDVNYPGTGTKRYKAYPLLSNTPSAVTKKSIHSACLHYRLSSIL